MNSALVKLGERTVKYFYLRNRVTMRLETTRRRFIALLSSLIALPQTKSLTWAQTRRPPAPGLKPAAADVLIWFTEAAPEWAAACRERDLAKTAAAEWAARV